MFCIENLLLVHYAGDNFPGILGKISFIIYINSSENNLSLIENLLTFRQPLLPSSEWLSTRGDAAVDSK